MILDATTKKLQVVLAGAITSAQLQVNVSWADTQNGATFVPGSNSAVTNSAVAVDIVAAPAASTQRQVKELTVQNTDSAAAAVTVQTVDGANTRKNIVVTLQTGETLFFSAGQWGVLATNGAIKGSAGVSSVAITVPADKSVAGSPITTTGTIAITDNTQSANTFKVGPASGAAATPTYRTLVAADLNSLAFTAGSIPFGNASGGLSQNNAVLFWDNTNAVMRINNTGGPAPTVSATTGLQIVGNVASSRAIFVDAAASNATLIGRRADTSFSAPSVLVASDQIMSFAAQGYDGSTYRNGGNFSFFADENWAAGTNSGTRLDVRMVPVGSITTQSTQSFYGDGRFAALGAQSDQSYSYQTPLTGATITPANTVETLICEPAGAIAALTVNMPAAPKDGQRFQFACNQGITLLTIQANAGQTLNGAVATTFIANQAFGWQYRAANTTWYRTHS